MSKHTTLCRLVPGQYVWNGFRIVRDCKDWVVADMDGKVLKQLTSFKAAKAAAITLAAERATVGIDAFQAQHSYQPTAAAVFTHRAERLAKYLAVARTLEEELNQIGWPDTQNIPIADAIHDIQNCASMLRAKLQETKDFCAGVAKYEAEKADG